MRQTSPPPNLPPKHDLDAEAAVLSAMLLQPDTADEVMDDLHAGDFYSDANRLIFTGISQLIAADTPVDVISLVGYLREVGRLEAVGGSPYLAQLSDATPALANIGHHARIVRDYARVRRVGDTFGQLAAEAKGEIPDITKWLEKCEAEAYRVTSPIDDKQTAAIIGDTAQLVYNQAAHSGGSQLVGYRCGFADLDNHTSGFCSPDLWYIAGRPGMGKTAVMMQMVEHLALHCAVIVFSLEMSKEQLLQRSFARRAQVPLHAIRNQRLDAAAWDRMAQAAEDLYRLPIIIDDDPFLTPARMRSKIRKHSATLRTRFPDYPLGVGAVDYVQLMSGDHRSENRNVEVSSISKGLKAMCKLFGISLAALSQLNRPDKNQKVKPPVLSDLRDSGSLEQDADNVLFIHRPSESLPIKERTDDAELILAKGRHCGPAHFDARFDGRFTEFLPPREAITQ